MIKGKKEEQESLNASDKNLGGPRRAPGFKIRSNQLVNFPQNSMTRNLFALKGLSRNVLFPVLETSVSKF